MVNTVNHHFQRMLSGMGCNGQVSLYCGCDDFNGCNAFDKYAIHIQVKFRDNEELQLLTANRQSGGERAVCTILYIIALQVRCSSSVHAWLIWASPAVTLLTLMHLRSPRQLSLVFVNWCL